MGEAGRASGARKTLSAQEKARGIVRIAAHGSLKSRGIISVGTNSTRALVARFDPMPQIAYEQSKGTRIGEGLKESGKLQDDAIRRTLDAVSEFAKCVRESTDDVVAIATSALRRAENGDEFAREIESITGAKLQIISGDEEARCSYAGALSGLLAAEGSAVVDTGGGSTEYATEEKHVSCEIGAVRLTEKFPALKGVASEHDLEQARKEARKALSPLRDFAQPQRLVFCGGSATTGYAVLAGGRSGKRYNPLERSQLQDLIARLASLSLDDRKELPGMVAQRADVLAAGALILDEIFEMTGQTHAVVSANDLLLGYLLRH